MFTFPAGMLSVRNGNYASITNGSTSLLQASSGAVFTLAIPWWVPAGTTRVRARLCSRISLTGVGNIAISGCALAIGTSNGSGDFSSAPTVYGVGGTGTVTIPASGAFYVSPWTSVTRGADGKVLVSYSVPSASAINYDTMPVGFSNLAGVSVSAYPLSGMSASAFNVATLVLDIESPAGRYCVLGDSIAIGFGASDLKNGAYQLLQTTGGKVCATAAVGGVKLQDYADYATKTWLWDYVDVSGSKVIIQAAVNDLGTRNLVQLQGDFTTVVNRLRGLGAVKIIAPTITPSTTYLAGNAVRVSYNAWLATLPLGIFSAPDVAAAVQNPSDHSLLEPTYTPDGLHLNNAGNLAYYTVLNAGI